MRTNSESSQSPRTWRKDNIQGAKNLVSVLKTVLQVNELTASFFLRDTKGRISEMPKRVRFQLIFLIFQ